MPRIAPLLLLLLAGCSAGTSRGVTTQNGTPSTTMVETEGRTYSLSSTPDRVVATEFVFEPQSKVWAALPAAYAAVGIPAGVVAQGSAFGNPDLRVANGRLAGARGAEFLDCGRSPIGVPVANAYTLHVNLVTSLESPRSGETRIVTRMHATAQPRTGGGSAECSSLGTLEKRIQDAVLTQLKQ